MEEISVQIAVDIAGMLGLVLILFTLTDERAARNPMNRKLADVFLAIFLMAMSDLLTCIFYGRTNRLVTLYLAKTSSYALSYLGFFPFLWYLEYALSFSKTEFLWYRRGLLTIAGIMVVFCMLNPIHRFFFTIDPVTGIYKRGRLYPLHSGIFSLIAVGCILMILMKKGVSRRKKTGLLVICGLCIITEIVQSFAKNPFFSNLGVMVAVFAAYSLQFAEQTKEAKRQELELENTRSALVLSQIQPHFLFNSMAAIMDLCDTDPKEAKDALQELSDYLHYKISAMSHTYMVPFSEDLDFMNNYLKLEKRRFGSRLQVEYDITCSNFQLPLLTLQPLVENSIRHGIKKRPKGGTVKIITRELPDRYCVRIEDDGVGFEVQADAPEQPNHVGLSNVRKRIAALCGGTLTIESQVGVGTTVELTIPKEKGGSTV